MALFDKSSVKPEDLAELQNKLNSAATKEDLTAISEQVKSFTSGLDELKATLRALGTPKPPDPVVTTPDEDVTRVLSDPKTFVADETKAIRDQQIQTQAQLEEMRARQDPRLKGAFEKYGAEMVELAGKMPVSQRAQPGFWQWHVRTFVGDKAISGKIDRDNFPSLIGSSTVTPNSDGSAPDPNSGFDPVVANWLKDRNVPLTKASKIRDLMQRDGEPITLANYKGAANA